MYSVVLMAALATGADATACHGCHGGCYGSGCYGGGCYGGCSSYYGGCYGCWGGGQAYYYILRAEVVRDGKTLSETRQVIVKAGEEVRASFNSMAAANTARPEIASQR